jgi:hypothetical protein
MMLTGELFRLSPPIAAGQLSLRLALLIAAGALPALPPPLAAPLAAALWLLGLLLAGRGWRGVDLAWLALPLLAAWLPAPLRAFGFAAAAAALPVSLLADAPRLRRLAAWWALWSLVIWTPAFQALPEALAGAASGLLGTLTGRPLNWGPGAAGLQLLVFFLLEGASAARPRAAGRAARWRQRLLRLALPATTWLLHQWLWLLLHPEPPARLPLAALLSLALVLALAGRLLPAGGDGPPAAQNPRLARTAAFVAALALLGFVWSATAVGETRVAGQRIAFREAGDWSWEVGRHGERAGPRLGGLLEVLRTWGAEVEVVSDSALLADSGRWDIVFAVHPRGPADPALRDELFRFVDRGGSLVVVGEHTDVGGILEGVNTLIEPSAIRLRDDSAIPALRGWNWAWNQRALLSPLTLGLEGSEDLGISIGASLEAGWPAMPLVVGTLAFSDTGNPANPRGKMGDNRYNWEERFGELPLVAVQAIGRGRLLVIGDTSGLMSLSSFRVWPHYLQLATGLAAPSRWESRPVLAGLLALLLAASAVALRGGAPGARWLGLALLAAAAAGSLRLDPRIPEPTRPERIGWLDHAHLPNWMYDSNLDWSVVSLAESVLNAGLLPLLRTETGRPALEGAPFVLLSGPARPPCAAEIARLEAYVQGGGHLVVAADARRGKPLRRLLERFGLGLLDTPLGTAPEAVDGQGRPLGFELYEAWPLRCEAPAETLASCWGQPLIVQRQLGEGRVSLVGDERFFSRYFIEGGDARGGKPLNTARRFQGASRRTSAGTGPPSPAAQAWQRANREALHHPELPAPERLPATFETSRARAWSLLGIRPSHPPGDPPAPGRGPAGLRSGPQPGAGDELRPLPQSRAGADTLAARRAAALRQAEQRREAARQAAAARRLAGEGSPPAPAGEDR